MGGLGRRGVGLLGLVVEPLDSAGRVGPVVVGLDQPEGARPAREDVHAPVLVALEHLGDLARAADLAQAILRGPDDPELRSGVEALGHHRAIARLEDVQWHGLGRERDDPQREERKVLLDHDAPSLRGRRTAAAG